MTKELDAFTSAYLTAAMWSSTVESEDRESPNYDKSFLDVFAFDDLAEETVDKAIADCKAFRIAAGNMLEEWTDEQAGHDFWLTRCGHGCGFWDRGKGDTGKALSALVGHGTAFPNRDMYLGDDGKIYTD